MSSGVIANNGLMDLSANCEPLRFPLACRMCSHLSGAGRAFALPVSRTSNFHLYFTD